MLTTIIAIILKHIHIFTLLPTYSLEKTNTYKNKEIILWPTN